MMKRGEIVTFLGIAALVTLIATSLATTFSLNNAKKIDIRNYAAGVTPTPAWYSFGKQAPVKNCNTLCATIGGQCTVSCPSTALLENSKYTVTVLSALKFQCRDIATNQYLNTCRYGVELGCDVLPKDHGSGIEYEENCCCQNVPTSTPTSTPSPTRTPTPTNTSTPTPTKTTTPTPTFTITPTPTVTPTPGITTYLYVSTTGDDLADNNCQSFAKPCQTINNAITLAPNNSFIKVATGTYKNDYAKLPYAQYVVSFAVDRNVTISGSYVESSSQDWVRSTTQWSTISGIQLNLPATNPEMYYTGGFSLSRGSAPGSVIVENFEIINFGSSLRGQRGIEISGGTLSDVGYKFIVRNNLIHNGYRLPITAGCYDDACFSIENNRIYNNNEGDSGSPGAITVGSCGGSIKNNFIYNNSITATGVCNENANGSAITVRTFSRSNYPCPLNNDSSATIISNNTFDSNTGGVCSAIFITTQSGTGGVGYGVNLKNNIIANSNIGVWAWNSTSPANLYNNIFYNNQQDSTGSDVFNKGGNLSSKTSTITLGFVNPAAGDYHIKQTSSAVNKGTDFFTDVGEVRKVFTDIDDQSRPQGTSYDVGAHELPVSQIRTTKSTTTTKNQSWFDQIRKFFRIK